MTEGNEFRPPKIYAIWVDARPESPIAGLSGFLSENSRRLFFTERGDAELKIRDMEALRLNRHPAAEYRCVEYPGEYDAERSIQAELLKTTAFYHIGNVNIFAAFQINHSQILIEQFPAAAYKRFALQILIFSRALADQKHACSPAAHAENQLGPRFPQRAVVATETCCFQCLPGFIHMHLSAFPLF